MKDIQAGALNAATLVISVHRVYSTDPDPARKPRPASQGALASQRNMRNNKRYMRKNATLAAILSPTRQAILTALFLRPEKEWYLTELASALGTGPSSLQREVDALVRVGILERRVDGRRSYLRAGRDSPIFPELRGLIEKTSGIVPLLLAAVGGARGLKAAFIYGSLARGEETAGSDVDLMVIGSVSSMNLSVKLRSVERVLGRQINPTVFSLDEFADRLAQKNHFLRTVMRGRKIMLVGTEDELESIARRTQSARASLEQAGTR